MNLININELITAGYNFTIADNDRDFNLDGELRGVTYDLSGYEALNPEFEEYLTLADDDPEEYYNAVDTYELLDDEDRWAHECDEYLRHRELKYALYLSLDTDGRSWREKQCMAEWRYQRFVRLSHYVERCFNPAKLRQMYNALKRRYMQTNAACAAGKNWWAMYLTKDQYACLTEYIWQQIRHLS